MACFVCLDDIDWLQAKVLKVVVLQHNFIKYVCVMSVCNQCNAVVRLDEMMHALLTPRFAESNFTKQVQECAISDGTCVTVVAG